MKTPPALKQLVSQIKAHGNAEPEVVGKPDGIGVYRSIKVNAATAKWLLPVLEVIADKRIQSIESNSKGQAVITFVPDTRADHRTEFPLEDVDSILRG